MPWVDFVPWPRVVPLHVTLAALAIRIGEIEIAALTAEASAIAHSPGFLCYGEVAVPLPNTMQAGQDPAFCGLLDPLIIDRPEFLRFYRSDGCQALAVSRELVPNSGLVFVATS